MNANAFIEEIKIDLTKGVKKEGRMFSVPKVVVGKDDAGYNFHDCEGIDERAGVWEISDQWAGRWDGALKSRGGEIGAAKAGK